MSKHVGIVSCNAEGAALCYRTLCAEAPALMGEHKHPEVSMHTYPLGCTEIPLLVNPEDCPLPTLDSTQLLARAALKEALKVEN